MKTKNTISGQVIYTGPTIPQLGIQCGTIFRNGIFKHLYGYIESCPALGELFVPIAKYAAVRRELNFDIARNMCGTTGRHVTFYREVQNWLAEKAKTATTTTGVKLKHHA
jgi:hypothetical protein